MYINGYTDNRTDEARAVRSGNVLKRVSSSEDEVGVPGASPS